MSEKQSKTAVSKARVGRLALRVEGDWWVAYYALLDTMEDAIRLGSLAMPFALNPARKAAFMTLMQEAVADILEVQVGERPEWSEPRAAPENERAGRS